MLATTFLRKQHREVLAKLKAAPKARDAAARDLLDDIARRLRLHTALEEEIFYPAVREAGRGKTDDMVLEALEEHHVVDLVLGELPRLDASDDAFAAKMTVLKELVEHHVEEEQDEMFPLAEKRLDRAALADLGRRMAERAEVLEGPVTARGRQLVGKVREAASRVVDAAKETAERLVRKVEPATTRAGR